MAKPCKTLPPRRVLTPLKGRSAFDRSADRSDLRELLDRLEPHGREIIEGELGKPNRARSNRTRAAWGSHGAFVYNLSGRYRGRWQDWSSDEGGDLLHFIQNHITDGDFKEAIQWAKHRVGWTDDTPPPLPRAAPRRREVEARKAAEEDRQRKDNQRRIDRARGYWNEAGPIAGTLGEAYLHVRGIKAETFPDKVRWHDKHQAVIVAVTDTAGELTGVQLIAVTQEGRKDADRVWNPNEPDDRRGKHSVGLIGAGAVRLPGSGPLLIAEGPETALTLWAATGRLTWAMLGGLRRAADLIEDKRRVIVCRDDDKRASNPLKAAKAAIAALNAKGCNAIEARPFSIAHGDGSDWNDLAQESGLDAVRDRMALFLDDAPTIAERLIPVEEARKRTKARVDTFFTEAAAWREDDEPPVHALGVSVGTGKTQAARDRAKQMLTKMRAAGDGRAIVIAVPEHRLSNEIAETFNADSRGLCAEGWRGREARKPDAQSDDERMCANLETVREGQRLCADIEKEICAVCPHKESCPYLAQASMTPDLLIVAHQMIFAGALPKPIKERGIAALVVDESPWQAGLFGTEAPIDIPLDAPSQWPAPEGDEGEKLKGCRERLVEALRKEPDGWVAKEALREAFIDTVAATEAHRAEWSRKVEDGNWRERHANKSLRRAALLWRNVESLAAIDGPEVSGRLDLTHNNDDVRVIRVSGRNEIKKAWRVPTLIVDALLDDKLIRPYWPKVKVVGQYDVEAPHQRIRQVSTKSFAISQLAPRNDPDKGKHLRRYVHATIEAEAREAGGRALVVGNKSVIEAMPTFSEVIDVAWFNAVAGLDRWRDVSLVVIVGRPQPNPHAVERIAGALAGAAPLPVGTDDGWYAKGDGFREIKVEGGYVRSPAETAIHPDPFAERIRSRICAGELVQAIGRGRGGNRTADDPLEVLVLTDVVLPLPVEVAEAETIRRAPHDLMLAAGGVAFEGAAAAATAYPDLWATTQAAKKALQRFTGGHSPIGGSYRTLSPTAERLVIFQKAGARQRPQMAWVSAKIANPQAKIEALLGVQLASFEVIEPDPTFEIVAGAKPSGVEGWNVLSVTCYADAVRFAAGGSKAQARSPPVGSVQSSTS